jgi:glycosyltransferase involved in cell wall biosynthesis
LDTEDLHFLREARRLALNRKRDDFKALLLNDIALRELASIYRSDLTLVISEYENELLQAHFGLDKSLLHYLPFLLQDGEIHDGKDCPSYSDRKDFMTMGNWKHGPNRDSVHYLKKEVWPALRRMMPEARIHIYGAYGGESDLALHDPSFGFFVEGWADSVKDIYFSHRVCLAPLRYGAGLKGKLIDSMRFGLPSVTTGVGTEGIAGDLPWNGFVADSPAQLAKCAVELYHDKAVWNESRLNGWRIVRERFREELFEKDLLNRLDVLISGIQEHRTNNFIGALLWHHSAQSTKYLSKWIEAKNQNKQAAPRSPGQTA